ncbi:NAD-dependent succinate-semialdehyde dehydrogenase [Sphingobium sp. BHU LFT2]|uniref:NAD-dependent succinate-semialdehyde dehydrogenase n=1 Tax=Sphingobium sp. BHU LFT2 TaxID=2807634 RepID=UPI001BEA3A3D|nr:NAD-dependent succinate-semialdehyde dehydrogenase [Sphingobium sp. BHU LFT2]
MSNYRTLNPADGKLVREYAQHSSDELEAALTLADSVYRSAEWRDEMPRRLDVLRRLGDLLTRDADRVATIITTEMGKPKAEALGEVQLCAQIALYYAENAEHVLAPKKIESPLGEAWIENHPVGVLIAVEPWNFPIYQLIRVVAPAIAVGNTVLMKHAQTTPECGVAFQELCREAGAPEGAVVNIFASNEQISDLIGDPRIQGVALTGSERAGAAVGARASQMLKKAVLELGGNDVFVVLDDADVEKAAKAAVSARLFNAGQACTSAKRFVVQKAVAERFTTLVREGMSAQWLGDPFDPHTTMGPLSSEGARDTLEHQVNTAIEHGARLLLGGKRLDRPGFFFEPTLLTDMTPDNPMYGAEFFGPVGQIHIVDTDEDVVTLANDSQFGLGGAIFSNNEQRARRIASRIESGMMHINTPSTSRPELPFGGVKRSGFGRELGELGLSEFVNKKLMVVAR